MSEQCYLVSAHLQWTEDAGEEKELCKPVVKFSNQCNQFFQVHFFVKVFVLHQLLPIHWL